MYVQHRALSVELKDIYDFLGLTEVDCLLPVVPHTFPFRQNLALWPSLEEFIIVAASKLRDHIVSHDCYCVHFSDLVCRIIYALHLGCNIRAVETPNLSEVSDACFGLAEVVRLATDSEELLLAVSRMLLPLPICSHGVRAMRFAEMMIAAATGPATAAMGLRLAHMAMETEEHAAIADNRAFEIAIGLIDTVIDRFAVHDLLILRQALLLIKSTCPGAFLHARSSHVDLLNDLLTAGFKQGELSAVVISLASHVISMLPDTILAVLDIRRIMNALFSTFALHFQSRSLSRRLLRAVLSLVTVQPQIIMPDIGLEALLAALSYHRCPVVGEMIANVIGNFNIPHPWRAVPGSIDAFSHFVQTGSDIAAGHFGKICCDLLEDCGHLQCDSFFINCELVDMFMANAALLPEVVAIRGLWGLAVCAPHYLAKSLHLFGVLTHVAVKLPRSNFIYNASIIFDILCRLMGAATTYASREVTTAPQLRPLMDIKRLQERAEVEKKWFLVRNAELEAPYQTEIVPHGPLLSQRFVTELLQSPFSQLISRAVAEVDIDPDAPDPLVVTLSLFIQAAKLPFDKSTDSFWVRDGFVGSGIGVG